MEYILRGLFVAYNPALSDYSLMQYDTVVVTAPMSSDGRATVNVGLRNRFKFASAAMSRIVGLLKGKYTAEVRLSSPSADVRFLPRTYRTCVKGSRPVVQTSAPAGTR